MIGHVLWYDKRDGYGIIIDESGEFYVDISTLRNCEDLSAGDTVSFSLNELIKSTRCATNVMRLAKPTRSEK